MGRETATQVVAKRDGAEDETMMVKLIVTITSLNKVIYFKALYSETKLVKCNINIVSTINLHTNMRFLTILFERRTSFKASPLCECGKKV